MAAPETGQRQYSFGEFTLDVDRGALRRGRDEVKLRRQSFDVLRYLVEHHGRLVTRTELMDSVWGGAVVTDGSLTQCLIDVRRALGDEARQTIRTVPRRGYIFEAAITESPPRPARAMASSRSAPRAERWPMTAGAVLLLAAAMAWWLVSFDSPAGNPFAARANYIAVLPFDDMSEAQDDTYDRELGDVLTLQSEIAAAVATALQATLSPGTASSPAGPENPEAYEALLQGRLFYNRRAEGDLKRAEEYFRRALGIDPTYGRAWAGLAGTYYVRMGSNDRATTGTAAAWEAAVEQALRYAPEDAEAQLRAAQFYWQDGKTDRAMQHLRQATVLGPNNPLVLTVLASISAFQGRLDEAITRQRQAVGLDPLGAVGHVNLAVMLIGAGRFEEALVEEQKALDLNPSHRENFEQSVAGILIAQGRFEEALKIVRQWQPGQHRDRGLAMAYFGLGRIADADAALERLLRQPGVDAAFSTAEVYAYRGDVDESFRWLKAAFEAPRRWDREMQQNEARLSAFLVALHDDPRWQQLLEHTRYGADTGAQPFL